MAAPSPPPAADPPNQEATSTMSSIKRAAARVIARMSPERGAKTLALSKFNSHPPDAAEGINGHVSSAVDSAEVGATPSLPPLHNSWWCDSCYRLNYVGDAGLITGPCIGCSGIDIVMNAYMLDPAEVEESKSVTGKFHCVDGDSGGGGDTALFRGVASSGLGSPEESESDEYYEPSMVDFGHSHYSSAGDEEDDMSIFGKTNQEVSKYSFLDRLEHYMERMPIKESNRKSVELAIMVEAGSIVREMAPMKKEQRAILFLNEYMEIIANIPDSRFDDPITRTNMQQRFKGMRGVELTADNLHRKYESEMTTLKKFSYKFGNLSNLPSGTTQLQQLRKPIVAKLRVEKNPNNAELNYDDPVAIDDEIPNDWWLEFDKCKYILSVLVHKDNKDISAAPVRLSSGPARTIVRENKRKSDLKESTDAKAQRPVVVLQRDGSEVLEKYGDVDHHL